MKRRANDNRKNFSIMYLDNTQDTIETLSVGPHYMRARAFNTHAQYTDTSDTASENIIYISGISWTLSNVTLNRSITRTLYGYKSLVVVTPIAGYIVPEEVSAVEGLDIEWDRKSDKLGYLYIKKKENKAEPSQMTITLEGTPEALKPLYFTAETGGATVCLDPPTGVTLHIEYSRDNLTWTAYNLGSALTLTTIGDKVYFRGSDSTISGTREALTSQFIISGMVRADGNIMSLITSEAVPQWGFKGLFKNCTGLKTAPRLPATEVRINGYESMFEGCTNLTAAPELPATNINRYCYKNMFKGCSLITMPPSLPATTLKSGCYSGMFADCVQLTSVPVLSATSLDIYCYSDMFNGCTNLVRAPALPAMTLPAGCYDGMFAGCTRLIYAPALPATSGNLKYTRMFAGCSSLAIWSAAKTGYTIEWRIPQSGTTEYYSADSMFAGCPGDYGNSAVIILNKTYYIANPLITTQDQINQEKIKSQIKVFKGGAG